jgi:hypothetical protein
MGNLPTFKDVIKREYAPGGVVNIEKLLSEGTETAVWSARLGKGTVIKFLILLISDLRNAFNVSRPMNESQITELAEDFVNDLWFVKFEEFPAFFEGIKKGTIGKVYERLDGPLIWEFWDIYAAKRAEVIELRQNALSFRDPGKEKSIEDKREGKIERLGDAFAQLRENLKDQTKK